MRLGAESYIDQELQLVSTGDIEQLLGQDSQLAMMDEALEEKPAQPAVAWL